ncbi:MAG: tetratricopeptide repeat protein [Rhodospirillales bacterium]|nr:tetratricopeptide repeat protein [Rhodospirillales bacterium]
MPELLDIIADGQTKPMTFREALELGKHRQNAGDLSGAADIYQQVHAADPGQVDALHLLGVISHQLGEHDLAAGLITAALAIQPDFADAQSNLGVVYFDQGRMDEAAVCYQRAIEINPELADPHINMGALHHRLGQLDEAVGRYRSALAINPNQAMAMASVGGILFEQQKFDEAERYLKQAADQDAIYECGPVSFLGDDFNTACDPVNLDRLISTLPETTGTFPSGSGKGPVVVTSCDHGYFRRFGSALALSVDQFAPGHDLHLHVINPEPSFDDEISALERRLGNTMLTTTTESAPETDRLYFHVIRFVRLCQMIEASERDFLHLDTDSLVHGPLASTTGIDADVDLSIFTRFDRIPFQQKVAIGSLFVRHTPMARRLMRRFGAYLAHCIHGNTLVWGLDQIAFYVVYRMMTFNGEEVSLASLPKSLCDFDFADTSDVWAAKGNSKQNQIFEQESSRLLGLPLP